MPNEVGEGEAPKSSARDEERAHQQGAQAGPGQKVVRLPPWRPLHEAGVEGVDTQRQSREAVGQQVQPQQLKWKERHAQVREEGKTTHDDQDLREVPADEILDDLSDVVVDPS